MRVAQVVAPARYGGAESVALHLAVALRSAGLVSHVVAIVPGAPDHPFIHAARSRDLTVEPITAAPRRYDVQARALAEYAARERVDVLHAHNPHADVVTLLAARRARLRCVATFHGYLGRSLRERAYEWVDSRALLGMSAVIAVARAGELGLRRRMPRLAGRLHVIPSALASDGRLPSHLARERLGICLGRRVIGWVGRFSAEKDPALFVQALAQLDRGGDWLAVMIGDGPDVESAQRSARRLGIADRVQFCGWRADSALLASAFDVLVVTSQREQLPMVVLEALAAGVPVVSVEVGDVPLLTRQGAGVVLAPRDASALAAALTGLLESEARRVALGAAGAEFVEAHHNPARWAERHEALYRAREGAATSRAS